MAERPLKILVATPELAPLVSTGGLADVAEALPKTLRARGHDVRLAMPCYSTLPAEHRGQQYCMCVADLGVKTEYGALRTSRVPESDIPLYLIEHENYFGRERLYGDGAYEYWDNPERFSFFALAVLHGVAQTGWAPDVIHGHDWHCASIPAHLKTRLRGDPRWSGVPVLFTIHNLAHQGRYDAGRFPATGLDPGLFNPECAEYHGDMNLLKAAIALSDMLSTGGPW